MTDETRALSRPYSASSLRGGVPMSATTGPGGTDSRAATDYHPHALERGSINASVMSGIITELPKSGRRRSTDRDSDCDTELLDVIDPPRANQYDHDVLGGKIYQQRCQELGVVPIGRFLRCIKSKELNLRNHNCGPMAMKALAAPLAINTCITNLELGSNDLQDRGTKYVVEALGENSFITFVGLSENGISPDGLEHVSKLLLNSTTITTLDLSGNHFGDASADDLEEIFLENRYLTDLDLSHNSLGEETGRLLGPAIASNDILISLNLSWNCLRLKGAVAIAKGLKENVRLRKLDLSWNGFGIEGATAIGAALPENETLVELNLSGNRLTDRAIMFIGQGLQKNEGLEILQLQQNPITNIGAYGLVQDLTKNNNSKLTELDIGGVVVRDDFMKAYAQLKKKQSITVHFILFQHSKDTMEITSFMTKLRNRGHTLATAFPNLMTEENKWLPRNEFCDRLQAIGVNLEEELLQKLLSSLDPDNSDVVDLGPLFEKYKPEAPAAHPHKTPEPTRESPAAHPHKTPEPTRESPEQEIDVPIEQADKEGDKDNNAQDNDNGENIQENLTDDVKNDDKRADTAQSQQAEPEQQQNSPAPEPEPEENTAATPAPKEGSFIKGTQTG